MSRKITATQFNMLLFICSTSYLSTIGSEALRDNFWDSILSLFLSLILGMLLSLPLLLHHDRNPAQYSTKTIPGVLRVFYILYFVLADTILLALTQSLVTSTVFPNTPVMLIGAIAISVAIYGAVKGIEAIARSGLFVFVIMLLGMTVVLIGLLPLFRLDNRSISLSEGPGDAFLNIGVIFARSTFLPQSVWLLVYVKEKAFTKSLWWGLGATVFATVIFMFVVHCLGEFADTQLFPVYTLSSVSQLIPIQRLDIVSGAVWLSSLAIHLSCDFLSMQACLTVPWARRFKKSFFPITGGIILLLSASITEQINLRFTQYAILPMFILAIFLGCAVPLSQKRRAK